MPSLRQAVPERAADAVDREAEKRAIKAAARHLLPPGKRRVRIARPRCDREELKERFAFLESVTDPTLKRLTTTDATVEKLADLLNENPRGLLNYRDELAGFFANLEKKGHEADRAFYLEAWDGLGTMRVDRIVRGSMNVKHLTLSIFGSIQPTVLEPHLNAAGSRRDDDGMIQRFQLLVYPDPPAGYTYIDREPAGEDGARRVFEGLYAITAEHVGAKRLTDKAGAHAYLTFDPEAQAFFEEWQTDLHRSLRDGSITSLALRSHLAKYSSLMPALALIFHLVDVVSGSGDAFSIGISNARLAAAWCSLLRAHAERLYGLGNTVGVRAAHDLLEHIEAGDLGESFTLRTALRKEWRNLKDHDTVISGLNVLCAHGHIEEITIQADGPGRKVNQFVVNRRLK